MKPGELGEMLQAAMKRYFPWKPKFLEQKKADEVEAVLSDSNIVENPEMADFDALQPGDILISSRLGSQREVLAINKKKKQIVMRTTRDSTLSGMSLPPFYREEGDRIYLSRDELLSLPSNAQVFVKNGTKYEPAIILSIIPGTNHEGRLQGQFSIDGIASYGSDNFKLIATKIIKKPSV